MTWFDESFVPEGWFDADLIPAPKLLPLLAVFMAVKPDYAHPQHDHDDLVAIGTADFLALALVVALAIKRGVAPSLGASATLRPVPLAA